MITYIPFLNTALFLDSAKRVLSTWVCKLNYFNRHSNTFYYASPTLSRIFGFFLYLCGFRHFFYLHPPRKSVGLSVSLSTGRSWNTCDNERMKSAHTYRFVRHGWPALLGNFREWRYRRNGSQTLFLITFGKLFQGFQLERRCRCPRAAMLMSPQRYIFFPKTTPLRADFFDFACKITPFSRKNQEKFSPFSVQIQSKFSPNCENPEEIGEAEMQNSR